MRNVASQDKIDFKYWLLKLTKYRQVTEYFTALCIMNSLVQ